MKNIKLVSIAMLFLAMISCSGSDTYRGSWKATDNDGNKFDISFDAKSFMIKDAGGKSKTYDYTQNSIESKNFVETYGIQLSDGRGYQLNFPNSKDESMGLIYDDTGNLLYTISRNSYIKNEDIYKLK